jgi:hypothetical protein
MTQVWPNLGVAVAFVGDPNDATSTPVWTDLSSRALGFDSKQGREY